MPYIKQEDREEYDPLGQVLMFPTDPASLQFVIARYIERYMKHAKPLNYKMINEIIGALEGAKLEFYRRYAAPYEDRKIIENGDV